MEPVMNTDPPKDKLSAPVSNIEMNCNQEGLSKFLSVCKRKSSIIGSDMPTPEKRLRTKSYDTASPLRSSWEVKRLKIDLIAAKAQITKLEARVNHQQGIYQEKQILFEVEKETLMEQHKRDERSVSNMEDRLQLSSKREQDLKDELTQAMKDHKDAKAKWDAEKQKLHKEIAELKDKLLEANVSSEAQISEMEKDMVELLKGLEGAQMEVAMLKKELAKQTSRAEQCTTLRIQLEKQTFELQQVTRKLKRLEYERDSYKDWQEQAKSAEKRLIKMADLEKEVVILRATELSLRDSICDTLFLEEEVNHLTSRLQVLEPVQQELHEAKVKIASLESALEEWVSAARAHGVESARSLSARLVSSLGNQRSADGSNSRAQQITQLTEELARVKCERNVALSKLKDLKTVRKNEESSTQQLKLELMLITRERDRFIQQISYYEQELMKTRFETNEDSRIRYLERMVHSYQELLAQLDQTSDLHALQNLSVELTKARRDADIVRQDIQKLRVQRDRLLSLLEKVETSAPTPPTKAFHSNENQAATAQNQVSADLAAAQEEITRLQAALNESVFVARVNSEEVAQLMKQLDDSRSELRRTEQESTSILEEYKTAYYRLVGYQLERTGPKNFRLTSMFARSPEEYMTFVICDEGVGMCLRNLGYSATLEQLIELHFRQQKSIPVFLGALTMFLFTRSTLYSLVNISDRR